MKTEIEETTGLNEINRIFNDMKKLSDERYEGDLRIVFNSISILFSQEIDGREINEEQKEQKAVTKAFSHILSTNKY